MRHHTAGMHMGHQSLTQRLEAFRSGWLARLPPSERDAILAAAEDLRAGGADRHALRQGDLAPDFAVADQHGRTVRLSDQLAYGPVVLLFVRGGWCPFCTLTLRAYQDALPAIHATGANLIGLTPEPADRCSGLAERELLAFPMLSDCGNAVADDYGVAYELAPTLRTVYRRLGHDLPRLNRTGNWRVPLPATFLIGTNGRVAHAHVEPVVHRRSEPADMIRMLEGTLSDV